MKPSRSSRTHLGYAFNLGRLMRVVGVDVEGELEGATLVHAWPEV